MAAPLRVLTVDDSADDVLFIMRELRRDGYDPVFDRVQTSAAMKAALENAKWDAIISDYVMPQFSGMEALRVLKESGQDLPFIIVSGKIGEDIAVAAMKAGAHDYILKDNLARLVPAVERELREAETRRQRRKSDEALKETFEKLDFMVEEKTAELSATNETLREEIVWRKKAEEEREKLICELRQALSEVKTLSGLLPICASCKKIRDDKGYWNQIEVYIRDHSQAEFSHGLCPIAPESSTTTISKTPKAANRYVLFVAGHLQLNAFTSCLSTSSF
jgi:response regulator RpfG family c-di-GMP phosphodiesterase